MRINSLYILTLSLTFLLISCSNDSPVSSGTTLDTTSFKYPFGIGSSWSYSMTISLSDFKPDTIIPYLTEYPMTITGSVSILYDTVINNITTKCFYDANQIDGPGAPCRYYYINSDTGLILYARRGGVSSFLPDNVSPRSLHMSVLSDRTRKENFFKTTYDTITITPENLILKYPIVTGIEWFVYGTGNTYIKRNYLGFGIVTVKAGSFSCMNVGKYYSNLSFASYNDFISKFGIIKRGSFFNDVLVTTPEHPEGIGTVDMTSITTLTSYTIN